LLRVWGPESVIRRWAGHTTRHTRAQAWATAGSSFLRCGAQSPVAAACSPSCTHLHASFGRSRRAALS
jgi:hypothetical protein